MSGSNPATVHHESNSGGRLGRVFSGIPISTLIILFINLAVFIYSIINTNLVGVSICYAPIVEYGEWSRLFSNAYFHNGFLHILMNMMTFWSLGPVLEKEFGSFSLLGLSFLFTWTQGVVYLLMSWILANTVGDPSYFYQCAVGYSGVLFAYIMLECAMAVLKGETHRSVFGCFVVSIWLYPVAMLVLISLMLQGVSWMGHLAGIIVGFLYVKGILLIFTLPRPALLWIEAKLVPSRLRSSPMYMPVPLNDPINNLYLACFRGDRCECMAAPAVACVSWTTVVIIYSQCFNLVRRLWNNRGAPASTHPATGLNDTSVSEDMTDIEAGRPRNARQAAALAAANRVAAQRNARGANRSSGATLNASSAVYGVAAVGAAATVASTSTPTSSTNAATSNNVSSQSTSSATTIHPSSSSSSSASTSSVSDVPPDMDIEGDLSSRSRGFFSLGRGRDGYARLETQEIELAENDIEPETDFEGIKSTVRVSPSLPSTETSSLLHSSPNSFVHSDEQLSHSTLQTSGDHAPPSYESDLNFESVRVTENNLRSSTYQNDPEE